MTKRIKKILNYVGFIGALVTGIMYLSLVVVMITGISKNLQLTQIIIFLVITAVAMFMGIICLRLQGTSLARREPENAALIKEYSELTANPDRRSLSYWTSNILITIVDLVFKVLTAIVQVAGVMYLAIVGVWQWSLFLTALVNVMMTASLGMLSLNGQYDREQNKYIPWVKARILKIKEEKGLTSHLTSDIMLNNDNNMEIDTKNENKTV